jgi:hypothetical protein
MRRTLLVCCRSCFIVFLLRHAAIGAAAILTGQAWTAEVRAQRAATEASAAKLGGTLSPDLNIVKEEKGPVLARGILQGRAWSIEFAHNRPHAHHL